MSTSKTKMIKELKNTKKEKKAKKPPRERIDHTQDLLSPDRGMDSLAKLLAGHSECVAVASIGDELCVAANEFNLGTQIDGRNENYQSIKSIVNYFRNAASNTSEKGTTASSRAANSSSLSAASEVGSNDRKKILQEICSGTKHFKIEPTELSGFDLSSSQAMILRIMNGEDPNVSTLLKEYGKHGVTAVSIWGTCHKLYRQFLKLEEHLKLSPSDKDRKTANETLAFPKKSNILRSEPRQTQVHAEVQILAYIVKMINEKKINQKQRIYIGISKLCCLHCRVMIEKANEIFAQKGIEIIVDVRGKHDLEFDANWRSPEIFSKGYKALEATATSKAATASGEPATASAKASDVKETAYFLEYEIGLESFKCIKEIMSSTSKPSKASMYGSQSDSEPELLLEEKIEKQINFLQQLRELYHNRSFGMEDPPNVISVAINLHRLDIFTEMMGYAQNQVVEKSKLIERFHAIYARVRSSAASAASSLASSSTLLDSAVTKGGLLGVLTNSLLCGTIAKYFNVLTLSDIAERVQPAATATKPDVTVGHVEIESSQQAKDVEKPKLKKPTISSVATAAAAATTVAATAAGTEASPLSEQLLAQQRRTLQAMPHPGPVPTVTAPPSSTPAYNASKKRKAKDLVSYDALSAVSEIATNPKTK